MNLSLKPLVFRNSYYKINEFLQRTSFRVELSVSRVVREPIWEQVGIKVADRILPKTIKWIR